MEWIGLAIAWILFAAIWYFITYNSLSDGIKLIGWRKG